MSHTPSPWALCPTPEGYAFIAKERERAWMKIAEVFVGTQERQANAALIAAAPELLDACEAALSMVDGGQPPNWDHIRAAVKTARQEPDPPAVAAPDALPQPPSSEPVP